MEFKNKFFFTVVIFLSVLFLFAGNRIASANMDVFEDPYEMPFYSGVVREILSQSSYAEDNDFGFWGNYILFEAQITNGVRRGQEVSATQYLSPFYLENEREVAVGDRIILVFDDFNGSYYFVNHIRLNYITILSVIFFVLVILLGRQKGFNSIVALGFICLAIFMVFIPAILSGKNIYITTIIICCFSIVSTLFIVIGPNKKAVSAMLGCLGGVFLSGLLMLTMDAVLGLTGILDQETRSLLFLPTENPINLRAIVFAGVIIGAVGAIMDVAMSIASALWEIRDAGGASNFGGIFKSGINIGKDILGTMLNTLILAYIGSSLSLILLITVHTTSLLELFNMEMIIVELLRALVGSFGMFLTIPLTAGICGWLYNKDIFGGFLR